MDESETNVKKKVHVTSTNFFFLPSIIIPMIEPAKEHPTEAIKMIKIQS